MSPGASNILPKIRRQINEWICLSLYLDSCIIQMFSHWGLAVPTNLTVQTVMFTFTHPDSKSFVNNSKETIHLRNPYSNSSGNSRSRVRSFAFELILCNMTLVLREQKSARGSSKQRSRKKKTLYKKSSDYAFHLCHGNKTFIVTRPCLCCA